MRVSGWRRWRWTAVALVVLASCAGVPSPHATALERAARDSSSCAATRPANGATGAPTRGARATRRSIRSTPSNFDSLQVAWQWNAGQFGEDEYYRTTPLYANGRLLHRRDDSPQGVRDRSRDRQDALAVGHRRRHSLAEGAAPVRRPRPRVLDRRHERARHRRHAGLSPRVDRRQDGQARSEVRQERRRRSHGRTRLSARAARRRRLRSAHHQRGRAGAQGAAGREVECHDEDRRRRHDGHRSGTRPDRHQLAGDRRRRRDRRRQLVDSRLLSRCDKHNIPGFIRGFDIHTGKQLWKFNLIPQPGEFGAETWKNGSKIGTDGVGKNDAWATYSADPELGLVYIPVGMPLIDEYGGHRPGNNLFGNSIVAIDVKTGKRKWHYQLVHHDIWDYDIADGAEPSRRHGQRPADGRSSRRRRSRVGSTCSIA